MIYNADYLEAEREYCSRSLLNYTKKAWHVLEPGMELKLGWAIECIFAHLEAVTAGEIKDLLLTVPFGLMKSLASCVLWPSFEWGPKNMPTNRILSASHDQKLAIRDNLRMRRLIESEWYQQLWPIKLTSDQNEKMNFENEHTGWRSACAAKSMTGRRADRVIWDDPQKAFDAGSAAEIENMIDLFSGVLPSRLNDPKKSATIIIMQRVDYRDAASLAIESGFYHVMLPMEFDKKRACASVIYPDPRTEEKELLFPDRFDQESVDKMKKKMILRKGLAFWEAQANQNPSPDGGNIIKTEYWRHYDKIPKGEILYRRMYCDTALKTEEKHDYSVFAVWGKHKNGNVYLLDLLRGKWEAPELEKRLIDFWNDQRAWDIPWYGQINQVMVEDKASGIGLIQGIKKRGGIPIIGFDPGDKDKYTRLKGVLGYLQSGMAYLPKEAAWLSAFILEHDLFTGDKKKKERDDQVDTTIMMLMDLCDEANLSWVANL